MLPLRATTCGKTTLAHTIAEQTGALYLDLEAREDRDIRTYLERDISQFGPRIPAETRTSAGAGIDLVLDLPKASRWRARLAALLRRSGLRASDAKGFAAVLIAASEGAVALSRAEKSLEPFDLTAAMLIDQVERLASRRKRR